MLGDLIRRLVGHKPAEPAQRVVAAAAGPALTPLAARGLEHYRNMPQPQGADFQVAARIFTEELLGAVDPADLVASLVISLPAITVDQIVKFQIKNGYQSIIAHGLNRLANIPVSDWRLSDQQI